MRGRCNGLLLLGDRLRGGFRSGRAADVIVWADDLKPFQWNRTDVVLGSFVLYGSR